MRRTSLVFSLFLLACGDNAAHPTGTPPDAAPLPDGQSPDAGPPGPTSRVWIVAEYESSTRFLAGGFLDGDTSPPSLPFSAQARPPVEVPETGRLPDQPYVINFSASRTTITYVADSTVPGSMDLYAADADGSDPRLLIRGIRRILANAVSPDGRSVAFIADFELTNAHDVYVIGTDGFSNARRVSPSRPPVANPTDLDVSGLSLAWSADSRYLAFAGDLTENDYQQAYVVDTSTNTATELLAITDIDATSGTRGVEGPLRFDANNRVYFRARLADDDRFALYRATSVATRTELPLPPRADRSVADAGAFALSPDGLTLHFSADSPTPAAFNVFSQPIDGGPPTNITHLSAPGHIDPVIAIATSPDGRYLAVSASFATTAYEPFVIATNGAGIRRLVDTSTTCTSCAPRLLELQWTEDNKGLYVLGRLRSNVSGIYRLVADLRDQAPTQVVVPAPNGIVKHVVVRPL